MKKRPKKRRVRAKRELNRLSEANAALAERHEELEYPRGATLDLDRSAPPELAELLLNFFARASQDEYARGDMRQIYVRDRAERGRVRADRLYWSSVLEYLLRRSLPLAAVVGFIKKLLVG
jgi:hypothetical protein